MDMSVSVYERRPDRWALLSLRHSEQLARAGYGEHPGRIKLASWLFLQRQQECYMNTKIKPAVIMAVLSMLSATRHAAPIAKPERVSTRWAFRMSRLSVRF